MKKKRKKEKKRKKKKKKRKRKEERERRIIKKEIMDKIKLPDYIDKLFCAYCGDEGVIPHTLRVNSEGKAYSELICTLPGCRKICFYFPEEEVIMYDIKEYSNEHWDKTRGEYIKRLNKHKTTVIKKRKENLTIIF